MPPKRRNAAKKTTQKKRKKDESDDEDFKSDYKHVRLSDLKSGGGRILLNNLIVLYNNFEIVDDEEDNTHGVRITLGEPDFTNSSSFRRVFIPKEDMIDICASHTKQLQVFAFKTKNSIKNIDMYDPVDTSSKSQGFIIMTPSDERHKQSSKSFCTFLNYFTSQPNSCLYEISDNPPPDLISDLVKPIKDATLDAENTNFDFKKPTQSLVTTNVQKSSVRRNVKKTSSPKASTSTSRKRSRNNLLNTSTDSIIEHDYNPVADDEWLSQYNHKNHLDLYKDDVTEMNHVDDHDHDDDDDDEPTLIDKNHDPEKVILEYKKIKITNQDLWRCNKGEFLNDNIIDFALQLFQDSFVPDPSTHPKFHIFHTTFFPLLKKDMNRVIGQPTNLHLFRQDFIFFPMNESSHWSLVVACHPGDSKNRKLMYCDSLFSGTNQSHFDIVNEYMNKRFEMEKNDLETNEDGITFERVRAELPKQTNSCDCGVYMIQYIELLASQFMKSYPVQNNSLFTKKQIDQKRIAIKSEINRLSMDYSPINDQDLSSSSDIIEL
ncbi:ubiquitin-like-specific protease [Acrasis kona]|uniref:Ubiquitin-like-specific protease n=1 Tax=Acrasis kona TaxID=1008807 RepID=A0AAW2Z532_9EUKA